MMSDAEMARLHEAIEKAEANGIRNEDDEALAQKCEDELTQEFKAIAGKA